MSDSTTSYRREKKPSLIKDLAPLLWYLFIVVLAVINFAHYKFINTLYLALLFLVPPIISLFYGVKNLIKNYRSGENKKIVSSLVTNIFMLFYIIPLIGVIALIAFVFMPSNMGFNKNTFINFTLVMVIISIICIAWLIIGAILLKKTDHLVQNYFFNYTTQEVDKIKNYLFLYNDLENNVEVVEGNEKVKVILRNEELSSEGDKKLNVNDLEKEIRNQGIRDSVFEVVKN